MEGLIKFLNESQDFNTIIEGLETRHSEQMVAGLTGSARALFLAAIDKKVEAPQLIVTHNLLQAQKLYDDLLSLSHGKKVFLYPVNELIASELAVASPEMRSQRIEVLNHLVTNEGGIVIAPMAGVRRLLPPPALWKNRQIDIRQGQEVEMNDLIEDLTSMGYQRTEMVDAPGQMSVRGGIIDLYPLTSDNPYRIEFFDVEIESIRTFDANSQRSVKKFKKASFGPAKELVLDDEHFQQAAKKLEEKLGSSLQKIKDQTTKDKMMQEITADLDKLNEKMSFQTMYKYSSLYYDQLYTLVDYFHEDTILFIDEVSRVQEIDQSLAREEADWMTMMLSQGTMVQGLEITKSYEEAIMRTPYAKIYLSLFMRNVPTINPGTIVNIQSKSMQNFHGQLQLLKGEVKRWKEADYGIVFISASASRAERLKNILEDYEIEATLSDADAKVAMGKAQIMIGQLSAGFEIPLQKLIVINEDEVFTKKVKKPKRKQKMSNAERIKNYSELKVGDWVVHINHGIGKYLGIETLNLGEIHKDYMNISYAGNDKLYVPVDQIDQVQKYVGSEDKEPKLYALGGSDWKKVKRKVHASVQDIADDLIKLYAERDQSRGVIFSKDGVEQREFESSFPYQETPDQIQAIEEIKKDMERERPMDRLLCGDVGYGKTEVALRAAFKAIMDGKQVAFLVPTTILAQQHAETMRERFQEFAINIGTLSRFKSRKEIKQTVAELKSGVCDIVVGTHRMLSKDIEFKDLGLLVVDEEQRFGVTHKEKIKQLKANVDVLTLTATPIPRTLHMSMLGVRDLSVIETPPENRFPVQTYVVEYNEGLVREAIEREMARGGQVFFLYNRVEDIESMADKIATLVPDATVRFAHGRMTETEMETVMLDFLEGEIDVLVTTTIIETGVDIPNVNTLIIHQADRMGLSQLYQLRGRVGRSNRVAYAYFTHLQDKVLTEVAEKRLQSIKEFTELGSGFKIAMRDLSIRGAGNLLGSQQHGFIASVGFDLYSQMLKEAIDERKEKSLGIEKTEQKEEKTIELDMKVDAYLPTTYISDSRQKIDMYKRFRSLETEEESLDLETEMIDRFGDYPDEVAHLFSISMIRVLAKRDEVEALIEKNNTCKITLTQDATDQTDGVKLFELIHRISPNTSAGTDGTKIVIYMKKKQLKDAAYLQAIIEILKRLDERKKESESVK